MFAQIKFYALIIFLVAILASMSYLYANWKIAEHKAFVAEQNLNYRDNNIGQGKELLKSELKNKVIDSMLKVNNIKPKNVEKLITVNYHTHNTFKDTSIVRSGDTLRCIEYNHKGIKITGCDGLYEVDQSFKATGLVHMKPTKKFLFIKYKKKPVLEAWNEFGDTLNIKLIEK